MTRFTTVETEGKTIQEVVAAYDLQVGITPDNMPSNFEQPFDKTFFSKRDLKKLEEKGMKNVGDFRFYTLEQFRTSKVKNAEQKFLNAIEQMLHAQKGWTLDLYLNHQDGVEIAELYLFQAECADLPEDSRPELKATILPVVRYKKTPEKLKLIMR